MLSSFTPVPQPTLFDLSRLSLIAPKLWNSLPQTLFDLSSGSDFKAEDLRKHIPLSAIPIHLHLNSMLCVLTLWLLKAMFPMTFSFVLACSSFSVSCVMLVCQISVDLLMTVCHLFLSLDLLWFYQVLLLNCAGVCFISVILWLFSPYWVANFKTLLRIL